MSNGGLSGPSARQSVGKSPEKDEKNLRNKFSSRPRSAAVKDKQFGFGSGLSAKGKRR